MTKEAWVTRGEGGREILGEDGVDEGEGERGRQA